MKVHVKRSNLTKQTNIEATKKIINLSSENNIKRIIFSTCSSYGVQDTNVMATESSPLNPVSLYAENEIYMEEYLSKNLTRSFLHNFKTFNSSWHFTRMRFDLIVNHFCKDTTTNKELEIFGGELWRPLMWLEKLVELLMPFLVQN